MADADMTAAQYRALFQGGTGNARAITLPHPTKPPPPDPTVSLPEATLLVLIQDLAHAHGWLGYHTYNPDGPDQGLHCVLVRDTVLFAEVRGPQGTLTPSQREWQKAIRQTPSAEAYLWRPQDVAAITARLARPRATAAAVAPPADYAAQASPSSG